MGDEVAMMYLGLAMFLSPAIPIADAVLNPDVEPSDDHAYCFAALLWVSGAGFHMMILAMFP